MSEQQITKERFMSIFKKKLNDLYERAEKVFDNFGVHLSWDVTNVLLHASDQGKVPEVLAILEKHFDEHLQYQHPDIRGGVSDSMKVNKTEKMFLSLCRNILKLKPNQ